MQSCCAVGLLASRLLLTLAQSCQVAAGFADFQCKVKLEHPFHLLPASLWLCLAGVSISEDKRPSIGSIFASPPLQVHF